MTTDAWNSSEEVYTASEVEAVLTALGIDVIDETENDFLSLCPYHGNTDSPAFSTSKRYGYSVCFNPSCAKGSEFRLTLEGLVRDIKGLDRLPAKRFVMANKDTGQDSFEEKFDSFEEEPEVVPFPEAAIDKMHDRFLDTPRAIEYMKGRGFTRETCEFFKVGFTPAATGHDVPVYRPWDMIVVPAYNHNGVPVGLVGRSIEGKHFKNYGPLDKGRGFHKSQIIWNLQNAKVNPTLIVTESTFDSMRIHQAGYPGVGALLGGSLSKTQTQLFNRYVTKTINFTDDENEHNKQMSYPVNCLKCLKQGYSYCQGHQPGRDLGMKITEALPRITHLWARYDKDYQYANHVKDASDMTDEEIRQCVKNALNHFDYLDMVA